MCVSHEHLATEATSSPSPQNTQNAVLNDPSDLRKAGSSSTDVAPRVWSGRQMLGQFAPCSHHHSEIFDTANPSEVKMPISFLNEQLRTATDESAATSRETYKFNGWSWDRINMVTWMLIALSVDGTGF